MYEVFGIFDSVEEINTCATSLVEEGDINNLWILAKENGIPEALVEMYLEGSYQGELSDWMNAAFGRLDVEVAEYKNNQIPAEPVVDYLKAQCTEEEFARQVRKKDKSLKECLHQIEEKCKEIQRKENKNWVADMTLFGWARDYYLEG